MDKALLRKKYLYQRQQYPLKTVASISEQILEKILKENWYLQAKTIFTYVSVKNEIDTVLLILQAIKDEKRVAVPKTYHKGKMMFYYIQSLEDLQPSKFGLLEPMDTANEAIPNETTLFVIPGVVFDYSCNRIGYGEGFYDRYLSQYPNICKMGLAYDEQVIESVPTDEYDISMDMIITEKHQYKKY